MKITDTSTIQKVAIDSELLSFAEIQEICKSLEQEITIEKVKVDEQERKRGVLDDPTVIIAIISASSAIIIALIKALVRIYEVNKLKGSITIKTDTQTVKIYGQGSVKDMQKWIDAIGKSTIFKQISLLSEDDDDEFDI
ncbi:hypothetical protein NXW27_18670 [Phocaeicola dorei]|nr:hypothetical protein [Phocaeicola dorei]